MGRLSNAWNQFAAAPHRMFLWGGAAFGVVAVTLWTVEQLSLFTPLLTPVIWRVPPTPAHALMMLYGLLGFYIFGFLLTTFPRWLEQAPIPRGIYESAWWCLAGGSLLWWIGLFRLPGAAALGCLAWAAGYAIATAGCLRVLLAARGQPREQQVAMCLGLAVAVVGLLAGADFLWRGTPWAYRLARDGGLYGFLLLVILPVVYRMVPFFTSTVTPGYTLRRSAHGVPLLVAAALLRAGLTLAEQPQWLWLADGALLVLLLRELVVWRCWRVRGPALLLILYAAMGWFVLSFALSTGESLGLLLGDAPYPLFGRAALHALVVGGFGNLLLGISTRVTLGHAGRGLATDRLVTTLFAVFQVVPLARIIPELLGRWLPAWAPHGFWAGFGWVLVFGLWLWHVGPLLWRARSDGQPG
jgi:uncharacterized protein involved in response to NO